MAEREIDIEKALLDPASIFAAPEEVEAEARLSLEQKIEILRRWEYDAAELAVAEEEGMPGGNGETLQRVVAALDRLAGGYDPGRSPPTKQGGLPRGALKKGG